MNTCEKCGKLNDGSFGSGRFCSRKCSNSRGPRSEDFKEQIGQKLKKIKVCPICNNEYSGQLKTCSKKCGRILARQTFINNKHNHKPVGGYRKGSGRGKSGWYKGFHCDSSWELAFLIYHLDHNINITRCNEKYDYKYCGDIHTYNPDFIIDDEYYEIKGFKSDQWQAKLDQFPYKLHVLYKDDINKYIDYVYKNYGKDIISLYDDYKPKYTYMCDFCGEEFNTEHKRKSIYKYCSRKCTGHGNKNYNRMWITNNKENKMINKYEEIPEGWRKGRFFK